MMSENTQTGAMNYDNLALKCWLYCIGPVRRCQELKKLKADLQNLGLSRRQVHQGLIQLATKPHVVLTRQIPYRRYRFKNLSEDERGKNIIDNLRTNALNLHPRIEDIHKSNTTERFIKEESKYIKKADGVTAYETALISSNRELFIPNICYKLKNPLATMHSFDETLKQLDKSISSKMKVDEKSTNTRKLENNIVSSKKCDKNENHHCIRKHKDTKKIREIPNLISDKVGSNRILMFNKYKKKRIEPKLKLNSCFAKKVSDSIKSDDYKKVYTKSIKLDIGKKLHNDKKLIDMKVNSIPDKNIYSKHEDSRLNCNHNTEEVTKMRENTHKGKLRNLIVSDKHKETIKKKRKLKDRFRTYFGDCISISEDEQEQNIIEERFRKTRKKDSVDSCESGVYVTERNIAMTAACVNIIQKSNEDTSQGIIANVDVNHKPNDDISQGIITNLDIIHKLNKSTSQGTIVNVDTNYGLNEDTSQRTIVNVDVIHESNEDTSQGIIANVDTNHKSNEGTSQSTIANIIQKSDEDTSQRTIVNVDVIHESNEDTSQGIIANVDTNYKSNEGTSQSTIANIIQKSDEDTSQRTIVNVDVIHESNEDTSQGIITNVDTNHKSNEGTSQSTIANIIQKSDDNTSQRTTVNVDVIHESNEDTSQGIIANVDTNHKSNEDTSQSTIANIIQKSDEDTSQGTIANVDTIHESNEDTSQGIIANVDTSHKSNEDTSQSTIANIIQKSDEDTSQGTIANVDTIHESNEVTGNTNNKTTNQIEGATNFVEIECNKLQNNTYENKTHNIEIEKKELSRNKFINFSEKNNIEKSKHASSVTDIFQITEQSKVNVSTTKMKATTEINNILPSDIPKICIPSHGTVTINKDFSGSERNNSFTKDFNDLLHMRLFKTCQIRSNGNVLSIQETDMNADVGESSNLKNLPEIQINCNQSITERILNHTEKNKKVQLSSNTNKTNNVISPNNISNVKNNKNKLAVKNSELNISEKKDIQSNKLPQGKLRVLSSAELGARWCPTPVNRVTSTVQFSHKNTETKKVPETIVSIPAPVSETASRTTIPENMKKYHIDLQFSESVCATLIKIRNLIQNIRVSPITNSNYDKLLNMEFQTLKKILNTDDFIDLTKGVVSILNQKMLVIPPLSLNELFCYAPSVKSYYVKILNKNKTTINNLNECRTAKSVGVPNQITLNQNRCCDAQVSQNIWASSVQSRLQYLLSISSEQGQTLCHNIVPNQPQQNFQEQIVLPLQNNILQSNVLVNPNTVNNNSHNNNMHQHTYRMQMHANFTQQKVSNVNFAKQNPVTNMHVRQSYPLQYSLFPPTGRNQLGGVHTSVPVTNASFINQQYVSSVFIPQSNTYCNVNVPNYTIQQNMNSTHMSQGPQLQGVLRSVSPNRNIPQPAQQNMNSTHMSQGPQLQGVLRSVSPNRNIPQPVQQNMNSTHMSQGPQLQGVLRSISPNRNIPQPVQQNMNSTHMSQGTQLQGVLRSVSPNRNIPQPVQQIMNSTHMSQGTQLQGVSRPVSPNHNIPQPVQQNMNSTHMSQGPQLQGVSRPVSPNRNIPQPVQQIMNSTHMSQGTQLQGVSRPVSPNRNIPQPVQQNMNSTHMLQGTQLQGVSRSVSPNRNIPQPVQQNMNSTHMLQGTQLQSVSRSVSPNRNIPQPVQTMVARNISHSVPKNSQHIEQKHKKIIPQKRIPMEVLQNRTSEQVASSQQLKKSTLRRLKKKENLQVSLESTTNLFDILKYISDIQKLILLKQLDYYFGCTTWLQQQFTSEKWQEIHSERSVLLYFQTLLKHLVEKTIKDLLPDNYQTNILKNIEIDVPKVIQITVKENNGICCQVEASKSNQEQYNAMNIKQNCTNYEENSNVTITQNQCEKEHEATDNSQTNSSSIKQNLQSHQTSNVDVCQENKVEREPNSSSTIHNSNTKEQNLDESKKITENIPQVGKEKLSTLSNMKLLDTLLQLNPHLVTVEISSKNDQVTVVDTNANSENTPKSEEPEEYQEHQHLKGTITDDLTVSSFKSPNNIEYFNNKESHNTSLERPPTTYIKDVRSISMEAYLRIGVTNNVPANTMEENIEEEEIKICLYCGKPSTVACIICLEAKYCSKECSQLHWGDHYKDCSPVERSVSS